MTKTKYSYLELKYEEKIGKKKSIIIYCTYMGPEVKCHEFTFKMLPIPNNL